MRLLSVKRYGVKLKATIQATGKLGFPKSTSDILRFEERQYVQFFFDDNEKRFVYGSPGRLQQGCV